MKTAEEWTMKLIGSKFIDDVDPNSLRVAADSITVSFIQQIQLDAMKEGMRRAAKIASYVIPTHEWTHEKAIITASEQLTIKDLEV